MEKHTRGVVSGKDRIFLLERAFIVPKWTLLLTSLVLNTRHTVQTLKKKKKRWVQVLIKVSLPVQARHLTDPGEAASSPSLSVK